MDTIFSVNLQVIGKDTEALKRSNGKFCNVLNTLTHSEIMDVCAAYGFTTAAVLIGDGKRTGSNVAGIRVAQLDFDNTWTIDAAMAHPLYANYCIGIYSTPSHGKKQLPISDDKAAMLPRDQVEILRTRVSLPMIRFRMLFVLANMLPADQIPAFYAGMFTRFPMADNACKDSARMFFGSPNAAVRHENSNARRMEATLVDELVTVGRHHAQQTRSPNAGTAQSTLADCGGTGGPQKQDFFSANTFIVLANGAITDCDALIAGLSGGYAHRVSCFAPFRNEQHPSAFAMKDEFGRLRIFDTATGTAYSYVKTTNFTGR